MAASLSDVLVDFPSTIPQETKAREELLATAVDILKSHQENVPALQKALQVVYSLTFGDKWEDADFPNLQARAALFCGEVGGLEATVAISSKHADNAALQSAICDAYIALSCFLNVKSMTAIVSKNGLTAVIAMIKAHPANVDLLTKCFTVAATVACNIAQAIKEYVGRKALKATVEALQKYGASSAPLSAAALDVFAALAPVFGDQNMSTIPEAPGLIETCVKAMQAHAGSALVQQMGLKAIKKICTTASGTNVCSRDFYLQRNGIQFTVDVMKAHRTADEVVDAGCSILTTYLGAHWQLPYKNVVELLDAATAMPFLQSIQDKNASAKQLVAYISREKSASTCRNVAKYCSIQ